MKIFAISDLHLCISGAKPMVIFGDGWANYQEEIKSDWLKNVCDDDVVIVAGDLSWAMHTPEAEQDLAYFENLPGTKIVVRGNHDYWWKSISAVRNLLPTKMYALQNDAIKIGDYIFCGTRGWTVKEKKPLSDEDQKIYNREVIRLELALSTAKSLQTNNEKIICIMHFPPFNSQRDGNEMLDLMFKYGVDTCVYGHLHGSMGKYEKKVILNNVKFYLTSCDILKNQLATIN